MHLIYVYSILFIAGEKPMKNSFYKFLQINFDVYKKCNFKHTRTNSFFVVVGSVTLLLSAKKKKEFTIL